MRQLATSVLIILTILVSAFYLPMVYEKLFYTRIEKTHLLYSPVTRRFIYKENIVGPPPAQALRKAEDHHTATAYRDADGSWYDRVEFEKRLPFIYYKNMELWGMLPLRFGDGVFDKPAIKRHRQVLELKPGEINGRRPLTPLWPLLESDPDQARLVFPEDRFRMTADAMAFVNADTNTVDNDLTAMFTRALQEKGFAFPARSVNGRFTILKPFDEGVFLVDDAWAVFHVKRRDNHPVVVRTPIDPALKTRHIKIAENRRREFYGLLLAGDGGLHLLTYDHYRLIRLPLEHYDADRMDAKVLVNPLYRTAVYSDDTIIRAVAMDNRYNVLDRYTHRMSRATVTPMHRARGILFPFSVRLNSAGQQYLSLSVQPGGRISLFGLLACLVGYGGVFYLRNRRLPGLTRLGLVAVTGLYGLIALNVLGGRR